MLFRSELKVTNVETVKGTTSDPKLPVGKVDLILMVDVYHEFEHPFEMTEKMVEALAPGGRLVFVEFRLEDPEVPIKLVHKMTEKQVIREMEPFPLRHVETQGDPATRMAANRNMGACLYWLGEFQPSATHMQRVLDTELLDLRGSIVPGPYTTCE